jgi:hypothetical protein
MSSATDSIAARSAVCSDSPAQAPPVHAGAPPYQRSEASIRRAIAASPHVNE